jgi:hypothetical protein
MLGGMGRGFGHGESSVGGSVVIVTPPTFVASAVASGTGAVTMNMPADYTTDDILVLAAQSANEPMQAPGSWAAGGTGWTEMTSSPQGTGTQADAAATRLTMWWKRAAWIGRVMAFRGVVASGSPFNEQAGDVLASAGTAVACPTITTTADGCLVVAVCAHGIDSAAAQFGVGFANSNLTDLNAIMFDSGFTSGVGGGLGAACGAKTRAGSTGTTTATLAASHTQGRITFALKPA